MAKVEQVKATAKKVDAVADAEGAKQPKQKGVNLGRKTAQPVGGFTEDADGDSEQKKQKTESSLQAKDDEASSADMFQCENCGS